MGGDASSILRTESKTARDRTYVHASNLPEGTKPVRPGWQFSEIAVLPNEQSSFVYLLDNRRIPSTSTQGQVMADQLKETAQRLARRFFFLGDGYYGSQTFREQTDKIVCDMFDLGGYNTSSSALPRTVFSIGNRLLRQRRQDLAIRSGTEIPLNSAIPTPMAYPTSSGKAWTPRTRKSRCVAGTTYISRRPISRR